MKKHDIVLRIWSLVGAGLLSFVALANNAWIPNLQSPILWGVLVGIAAIAVFVPHLGALLACAALVATFISHEYYVVAAVLGVASIAWWWWIARDAFAQTNTGLSSVPFGAVGLGHAIPLLAGYYLDTKQAIGSTLFASLLAVLLASMGSGDITGWWPYLYWHNLGPGYMDALINILRNTSTWITIASWVLASIVMALLCGFGKKGLGILGALLASVLLVAGVVACTWVGSGFTSYRPPMTPLALAAVCSVAAAVLCAIKAPEVD